MVSVPLPPPRVPHVEAIHVTREVLQSQATLDAKSLLPRWSNLSERMPFLNSIKWVIGGSIRWKRFSRQLERLITRVSATKLLVETPSLTFIILGFPGHTTGSVKSAALLWGLAEQQKICHCYKIQWWFLRLNKTGRNAGTGWCSVGSIWAPIYDSHAFWFY